MPECNILNFENEHTIAFYKNNFAGAIISMYYEW